MHCTTLNGSTGTADANFALTAKLAMLDTRAVNVQLHNAHVAKLLELGKSHIRLARAIYVRRPYVTRTYVYKYV